MPRFDLWVCVSVILSVWLVDDAFVERMVRDDGCSVFLALAGAMVPADLRRIILDLLRRKLIDVVVSIGSRMARNFAATIGITTRINILPKCSVSIVI